MVSNRLQEDSKDRLWFFRKNASAIESVPLDEPLEILSTSNVPLEVLSTLDIVALGSNNKMPESTLGTVYYNFDVVLEEDEFEVTLDED